MLQSRDKQLRFLYRTIKMPVLFRSFSCIFPSLTWRGGALVSVASRFSQGRESQRSDTRILKFERAAWLPSPSGDSAPPHHWTSHISAGSGRGLKSRRSPSITFLVTDWSRWRWSELKFGFILNNLYTPYYDSIDFKRTHHNLAALDQLKRVGLDGY